MPAGSFLKYPVHSTRELLDQVKNEPTVAARFSRLFNMSPDMVRLAFGKLRLVRLEKPMNRRIYYVHRFETLGYKMRKVGQGTLVFAYPDGTPVLMQICGNPLRTMPFGYGMPGSGSPTVPDYSDALDNRVSSDSTDASPQKLRSVAPGPNGPALAVLDTLPDDFVVSEDVIPADQIVPGYHVSSPGSGLRISAITQILGWIAGIGSIAAIASSGGGGSVSTSTNTDGNGGGTTGGGEVGTGGNGGGGGSTPTGGSSGGDTTPPGGGNTGSSVVPESSSILLFLFGATAFFGIMWLGRRVFPLKV